MSPYCSQETSYSSCKKVETGLNNMSLSRTKPCFHIPASEMYRRYKITTLNER